MAISRFVRWIDSKKQIKLYGDGTAERDFTFIDDAINGIRLSMKKHYKKEIFNIGTGKIISINKLIELIENKLGKKAKIKYLPAQKGDMNRTFADISKAKIKLGYSPKISIEDGISQYVDWYLKRKEDPEFPII